MTRRGLGATSLLLLWGSIGCAGTQRGNPETSRAQAAPQVEAKHASSPGPDAACQLAGVPVRVEYLDAAGGAALRLETPEPSRTALREHITHVADEHNGAGTQPGAHSAYDRPHTAVAQDIEGGVQLTLLPQRPTDLDALRRDVQQDVFAMQRGDCSRLTDLIPE
jgi:hypothetical protein